MKLNWDFQRDGRVLKKIPSMGEVHVWIFSGTNLSLDHFTKPYLNHLSVWVSISHGLCFYSLHLCKVILQTTSVMSV